MSRHRKPVEMRLLDGTYQPSRHGPLPADLGDAFAPPVKPSDLKGDASKLWDTLTVMLAGVVRDRDGLMLAELCQWWAELRRVKTVLAATTPDAKGYNGLLVAAAVCTDKLDKIASRFGLTPSDRAKLGAESTGPVKPRVATRPKTALDQSGPPKPKGK